MKTVLVVDDEFGITDALRDLLTDEGFQVVVARNGKDGLKRLAEHRPDIVLLDYMMPVMNGRDVMLAMARDEALRHIPVVLMSAVPRSSLPADCQPSLFLRKPFEVEVLLSALDRLLSPGEGPG
jgi:CheY-like chemotaxis protein